MKRLMLGLTAAASVLAFAPAAYADPLAPGATLVPFTPVDGAFLSTQGDRLAFSVVNAEAETTATVTPTYNANFRTAVYRNTLGTLDFYYQLAVNSIFATDEISGISAFNFAGFTVNAFVAGAGVDPDGMGTVFTVPNNPNPDMMNPGFTSTASRNGAGGTIRADFGGNGLERAGEVSATYIFRTNATAFTNGTFTAQDGTVVTVAGFAPSAVPEPATWGMMIVGFGVVGAALRRRRTPVLAKA